MINLISIATNENIKECIDNFIKFARVGDIGYIESIEGLDVSRVTDMKGLFKDAILEVELDLSMWDVSNVTNMARIFSGLQLKNKEKTLNIKWWDVSNVTDMRNMFSFSNIAEDLSYWNFQNATDVSNIFLCSPMEDYQVAATLPKISNYFTELFNQSAFIEATQKIKDATLCKYHIISHNFFKAFDSLEDIDHISKKDIAHCIDCSLNIDSKNMGTPCRSNKKVRKIMEAFAQFPNFSGINLVEVVHAHFNPPEIISIDLGAFDFNP